MLETGETTIQNLSMCNSTVDLTQFMAIDFICVTFCSIQNCVFISFLTVHPVYLYKNCTKLFYTS